MQITITTPHPVPAHQASEALKLASAVLADADAVEAVAITCDAQWLTCYTVAGHQGATELFCWDPNSTNPNGWAYWHSEWPQDLPGWAQ